jgi:hypothetical protein
MLAVTTHSGFGAGPPSPPVTYSHTATLTNAASASTNTFSSTAFGAAASNRLILVTYAGNGGSSSITGTAGGVTLDTVVEELRSPGGQDVWMGIAAVPTGTTGTVVVNHTTGTYVGAVYSIYGASATAHDTDTHNADNVTVGSCTIDVPAKGMALGAFSFGSSGALTSLAWVGITEDHETFSGTAYTYGGGASATFASASSSLNITCTRAGGAGNSWQAMCVASFGQA